jgi:hypothetical protein
MSDLPHVNEPNLVPWGRAVFCASCAQRLLPVYLGFCRRDEVAPEFADWLHMAWEVLAGREQLSKAELEEHDREALDAVPSGGGPGVQDTALAVVQVLRELLQTWPGKVTGCGKRLVREIETYLVHELSVSIEDVSEHALVREEMDRQERDLKELASVGEPPSEQRGALVDLFRERATREGLAFLVRED